MINTGLFPDIKNIKVQKNIIKTAQIVFHAKKKTNHFFYRFPNFPPANQWVFGYQLEKRRYPQLTTLSGEP